jgi:hypothetical protein
LATIPFTANGIQNGAKRWRVLENEDPVAALALLWLV